jgi:hypothetical protein
MIIYKLLDQHPAPKAEPMQIEFSLDEEKSKVYISIEDPIDSQAMQCIVVELKHLEQVVKQLKNDAKR